MVWVKRNVTDQNVEFPNRFKIDGESKIIEPNFGTIVDPGTPINRQYLQPIEDYLEIVETKDGAQAKVDTLAGEGNTKTVKQLDDEVKTHLNDIMPHQSGLNVYVDTNSLDANGIYTVVNYKRADGTLYMKSTLSGGTSPNYTTDTWQFYDDTGTTVVLTKIWTLTYDADGKIISKVVA